MYFAISLGILIGLILYFTINRSWMGKTDRVIGSLSASFTVFAMIMLSQIVFNPASKFNLQTYCKSEPNETVELVSVSESCKNSVSADYVGVVNPLNAGKKFVVTDGEIYYCVASILPNKRLPPVILQFKKTDEIQIMEFDSPYAGAGVMKVYRCEYASWWAKFFFNKPGTEKKKRVFSIPVGTLGKGKIVIPNTTPVFVPTS